MVYYFLLLLYMKLIKKSTNNKNEIYGDFSITDELEDNEGNDILNSIANPSYLTQNFTLTEVSITFVCTTITATSTSSTQTVKFYKYGSNTVFVYIPSFTINMGTISSSITTSTGSIPSGLRPTTAAERSIYPWIQNTTYGNGIHICQTDGAFYFSSNANNTGRFSVTTVAGVAYPFMYSYII